jgi:hypothetical protein
MHTLGVLLVIEKNRMAETREMVTSRAIPTYLGYVGCDKVEYIAKNKELSDE